MPRPVSEMAGSFPTRAEAEADTDSTRTVVSCFAEVGCFVSLLEVRARRGDFKLQHACTQYCVHIRCWHITFTCPRSWYEILVWRHLASTSNEGKMCKRFPDQIMGLTCSLAVTLLEVHSVSLMCCASSVGNTCCFPHRVTKRPLPQSGTAQSRPGLERPAGGCLL